MKKILLAITFLALATPALANSNGNDVIGNTGIAAGGDINGPINTGPGAGGTFAVTGGTSSATSDSTSSARQTQSATSGVSGSGNSSVSIENRKQAPAVFAPGLVAGFDCLGSHAGGISGPVGGITIGGTEPNEDCINVYLSRELERKGDKDGSWGVLCESEKVRKHSSHCPLRDADHYGTQESEYPSTSSDSPKH